MGTILFTWELGGGLGHMMQILPLARELRLRNHNVFVAVRDLSRARSVFGDGLVTLLQAPVKIGPPTTAFRPPHTLAHILHNVGYGVTDELAGLVAAWRGLFQLIHPDVVLFDHSPTALIGSRGFRSARIPIGAGFFCPPDEHPLPNLRSWQPVNLAGLASDEEHVLKDINGVLKLHSAPTLDRIGQLYSDVDDTFLLTFRELDHYSNRADGARYRGTWVGPQGRKVQWPKGEGKKIYAYLKNFPALPELLNHLRETGLPTIIFVDGISQTIQERFASPTLRFENERLDIQAIAKECDFGIMNANHGTAIALLMAGKPTFLLPLFLEQMLFARAVERLGAGVQAETDNVDQIKAALGRMLSEPRFGQAASAFAARYVDFDPVRENEQMVERIEALIS